MNKVFLKIFSKFLRAKETVAHNDIELDDSLARSIYKLFACVEGEGGRIEVLALSTLIESILLVAIGLMFLNLPTIQHQNPSQVYLMKWAFIIVLLFLAGGWNLIAWRELRFAREWKYRINRLREVEGKLLSELDREHM